MGLTVYDLPEPQAVAQADEQRTAQGRWRMLMVLLVCAAPVIASYFTYYVIRPEARRNHGELIQPTKALPDIPTRTLQGEAGQLTALKGQWLLISVSSGACDERCQQHLYLQRQILTGLGRERDRTDWVWLIDDEAPVPPSIQPGLAEAVVLRVPSEALSCALDEVRTFPEPIQRLLGYEPGAYALGYIEGGRSPMTLLSDTPAAGAQSFQP